MEVSVLGCESYDVSKDCSAFVLSVLGLLDTEAEDTAILRKVGK